MPLAKGNEITDSSGQQVRLSRAQDFLAVTDHPGNVVFSRNCSRTRHRCLPILEQSAEALIKSLPAVNVIEPEVLSETTLPERRGHPTTANAIQPITENVNRRPPAARESLAHLVALLCGSLSVIQTARFEALSFNRPSLS
ncbi:DUF3604 domain-containing protein [Roseovarius pelagicus]|uniref:DUF3604 domain-containing protein n=1 Tax=Roseovarius pelagicus TaxID=2980108 RepID=UPI0035715EC2